MNLNDKKTPFYLPKKADKRELLFQMIARR